MFGPPNRWPPHTVTHAIAHWTDRLEFNTGGWIYDWSTFRYVFPLVTFFERYLALGGTVLTSTHRDGYHYEDEYS
jgi:hypothetical protein